MFIVIDGIDGAGSETQGRMVSEALKKANVPVVLRNYPNYETSIGKTIREFLYENKALSVEQQFLLYSLQFIVDGEAIKKESEEGVVIADRYFSTTLVFQTLQGMTESTAVQFAQDFGVVKPDFVFFLDVRPEVAFKWKQGEEKEKNAWEKDLEFMTHTYEKYKDLAQRQVFAPWIRVDGERTKEEVCDTIVQKILLEGKS